MEKETKDKAESLKLWEDKFFEQLDKKIEHIPSSLFQTSPSMSAKELRDRILELNNHASYFSELQIRSSLKRDKQKIKCDQIESLASRLISKDKNFESFSAKLKELAIETYEIELFDGQKTSLNEEKVKLQLFNYAVNRFKGKLEDINDTKMACTVALSYDKQELASLGV